MQVLQGEGVDWLALILHRLARRGCPGRVPPCHWFTARSLGPASRVYTQPTWRATSSLRYRDNSLCPSSIRCSGPTSPCRRPFTRLRSPWCVRRVWSAGCLDGMEPSAVITRGRSGLGARCVWPRLTASVCRRAPIGEAEVSTHS